MSSPVPGCRRGGQSGSRFLAIATEGLDLITQQARSLLIAACQSDGKGELKLFKLMLPFDLDS